MDRHNPKDPSVFPYEKREDELLMLQYAAGDTLAFQELYGRYRARAYGYLSRRVRTPAVADELFQKIFLKLHRSREKFEPGRTFSTWFFTICRNVVIDEMRSQARAPHLTSLEGDLPAGSPEDDNFTEPVPAVVLSAIPERQREAVRLRYEEELDFDEIALKLNTNSENVRQLVSRGVRKLRDIFGKKNE